MSMNFNILAVLLLAVSCSSVIANTQATEPEKNAPFELDAIEVVRGNLSFAEELTLRIVRQGFKEVPSNKQEDRDKMVCWISKPVGSRLSELDCARNGDIWASRPETMRVGGRIDNTQYTGMGYGEFMIASRPITRGKLKKILAALPGSDAFDKEFIDLAVKGAKPPRDIPSEEEMDQYAKAWLQVNLLSKQGQSEDVQIAAIKAENLTLKRYNRIAEFTEIYASIKNDIASRVKLFR